MHSRKLTTHYLDERGCKPKVNVMDNECSKAVEQHITGQGIDIELCPPRNHRGNGPGERAIRTYKDHLISMLATVDPECPIQLWDEFLEQATDTLNLLRTSRRNAKISAYEELNGEFDYNKTPLVPVGTESIIYNDPEDRNSFEPRAIKAIAVGRAKLHYRCLKFWIPATRGFRISDTYRLYPKHCRMPTISEADETLLAAKDVMQAWEQLSERSKKKLTHNGSLKKLMDILNNEPADGSTRQVTQLPASSCDTMAKCRIWTARLVH